MPNMLLDTNKESESSKPSWTSRLLSASSLAKFGAFLTVITGTVGVCQQKGLLEKMKLGNIKGSYSVEEIFNSALNSYAYIFSNFSDSLNKFSSKDIFFESAFWFGISALSASITLLNRRLIIKTGMRAINQCGFIFNVRKSFLIALLSILVSQLMAWLMSIITPAIISIIMTVSAILLVPAAVGYKMGYHQAEEAQKEPPCVHPHEILINGNKPDKFAQCTQIRIKGKTLQGKILLQNEDGYFMRLNHAFIFISQDRERCIYAKDEEIKDIESFNFEKNKIDDFCSENS